MREIKKLKHINNDRCAFHSHCIHQPKGKQGGRSRVACLGCRSGSSEDSVLKLEEGSWSLLVHCLCCR